MKLQKLLGLSLLAGTLGICTPQSGSAQTKSLFQELALTPATLKPGQMTIYRSLAGNPDLTDIRFISVEDLTAVQDKGKVLINLSFLPCANLVYSFRDADYASSKDFSWYGEIPFIEGDTTRPDSCFNGSVFIQKKPSSSFGTIGLLTVGNNGYQIYDLGDNVCAIGRIADISGKTCADGSFEEKPTGPIVEPEGCIDRRLKVLVLYTAAAKNYVPDVNAVAALSVFQTNTIFHNSKDYNQDITLAGVALLPGFVEDPVGGKMNADLTGKLIPPGTSYNIYAEYLRDLYHADAVILLVAPSYSGDLGLSGDIFAAYDKAYAMVDITKATGSDYIFTHELSHLMGARHFSDLTTGYSHGHYMEYGFFKWLGGWATTKRLATLPKPGSYSGTTIPYLSNPDVKYDGKWIGRSADRDAARTIRENYATIASYKTEMTGLINNMDINIYTLPPNPPFQYVCDRAAHVIANAGCGTAPYTHEWFRSEDGINFYSVGTGSNIDVSGAPYVGQIKLVSTDALGNSVTTIRTLDFGCSPQYANQGIYKMQAPATAAIESFSIQENPNNGNFKVLYTCPQSTNATIYITDLLGRKVYDAPNTPLNEASNASFSVNMQQQMPGGIYLLHIETPRTTQTIKFQVK